jgi:hypothetical protein
LSYQYPQGGPQGSWQGGPQPPYRPHVPQPHPSARVALFLGLGAALLGPLTGVPAILVAGGVARDIERSPRSFSGGLPLAAGGAIFGWLGSALWLAFAVRSMLVMSKAAAVAAVVFAAALIAVGVCGITLPKLQRFASRTNVALVGCLAFALLLPGLQFFGARSTLSDRCDSLVRDADAFAQSTADNAALTTDDVRERIERSGRMLTAAEQACGVASRTDQLRSIDAARAKLSKQRGDNERKAAEALKTSAEDRRLDAARVAENATVNAKAVAGANARAALTLAKQYAAKGDWEKLTDSIASIRAEVGKCRWTGPDGEAHYWPPCDADVIVKVEHDLAAIEQANKTQLERVVAARAKAAAEAAERPSPRAAFVFAKYHCAHSAMFDFAPGQCVGSFVVLCDPDAAGELAAVGCQHLPRSDGVPSIGFCCPSAPADTE